MSCSLIGWQISKKSQLLLAEGLGLPGGAVGCFCALGGLAFDGEGHLGTFLAFILGQIAQFLLLGGGSLLHLRDLAVEVVLRLLEGAGEQVDEGVDVEGSGHHFLLVALEVKIEGRRGFL